MDACFERAALRLIKQCVLVKGWRSALIKITVSLHTDSHCV